MARGTPTFAAELPLATTPHDERVLDVRFRAGQNLLNGCRDEGLKRLNKMKRSPEWKAARDMPKRTEAQKKARWAAFDAVRQQFGFTQGALQSFAIEMKNACWIGEHLGPHEVQKIADRAFDAVDQYCYGNKGRPRVKNRERFRSIEGKSNEAGIMWKPAHDKVRKGKKVHVPACVKWNGLTLRALVDTRDNRHALPLAYALTCRVKYVRIVRRRLRGRVRYYAQLILEGLTWQKPREVKTGKVGGDLGPTSFAAVGDTGAELRALAPSLSPYVARKQELQRAMDRSLRALNPDNYHPNGKPKKGCRKWVKSNHYLEMQAELREIERILVVIRRKEHGELVRDLLKLGNEFRVEKLSGEALKKRYGKAVLDCAPMEFLKLLARKAVRTGGGVKDFPAWRWSLSQYNHKTDERVKKPLKLRWMDFGDGTEPVQRDLYSALLARHVTPPTDDDPVGAFDTDKVKQDWASAEPLLKQAVSRAYQSSQQPGSGRRLRVPAAFGFSRAPSGWRLSETGSLVKEEAAQAEVSPADAQICESAA